MKKIVLSLALMAFGFMNAQETSNMPTNSTGFATGDVFITGSVGIGSEATGDNSTNSFRVMPKAGYFINPNVALGAAVGYSKSTTESPGVRDVENREFAIGVFGRYYVTPASGFSVFGELGVDYINSTIDAGIAEDTSNAVRVGIAPGVNYFISQHFALEATFGILSFRTDNPEADGVESTDNFNLGLNFTDINIGLIYRF